MPNASERVPLPSRTRQEMEMAIGVEPIMSLQAYRQTLVEQIAPLRARYGPGGTWDARRKVLRLARQTEIVNALMVSGRKAPSEAEGERLAASDPRVVAQLDEIEREMARYYLLEDRIRQIDERIRRDEGLLRYAAFEPRG